MKKGNTCRQMPVPTTAIMFNTLTIKQLVAHMHTYNDSVNYK